MARLRVINVQFFVNIFSLLDDLGHEVDMTDSRLQQTLLKIEKVLRLSSGMSVILCLHNGLWANLHVSKLL